MQCGAVRCGAVRCKVRCGGQQRPSAHASRLRDLRRKLRREGRCGPCVWRTHAWFVTLIGSETEACFRFSNDRVVKPLLPVVRKTFEPFRLGIEHFEAFEGSRDLSLVLLQPVKCERRMYPDIRHGSCHAHQHLTNTRETSCGE